MGYLGTKELAEILPNCIDKFNTERIANVAYELCLGDEAYLTDSKSGKKEILDAKNPQVVIKPGQFALLLTDENVTIPNDILAFISIKFSQKIKGLINVSGFHVDPGFNGKIIFSVYNAGPAKITLDKGEPYFMIWFSRLTSESVPYSGKHNQQKSISATNINDLNGELASPNTLLKRIKANETKLATFSVVAGVLMTIGIGLSLKSLFDAGKFNEGYNVGIKEKRVEQYVDSTISNININHIIEYKVDSILKMKTTNDGPKK